MNKILQLKRENSKYKISHLSNYLQNLPELDHFKEMSIFVAGSYARKEASEYSDIDLFFVVNCKMDEIDSPKIKALRLFSKIIEIADEMKFPAFSNDGWFLDIIEYPKMEQELGGPNDDYSNYFTARMLMLLESEPVFGSEIYEKILENIVKSYFRDYKHHPRDFLPIFLRVMPS